MRRVLWEIPGLGLRLPGFGSMLAVACAAALWLTFRRARRAGIAQEHVAGLAAWLMTGGLIGARALYVVSHPGEVQSISDLVRIGQGGIVYYGCILGGLFGSILYWWRRPFPFAAMADAVAPPLMLGAALGRVGCLLNGCCYGGESQLPWAIRFPDGSLPWSRHLEAGRIAPWASTSLPVHPTQVYAIVDGLLLLALLTAYFPRRRRDGEAMALLMVTYPVTRFLIEGLRDDEPRVLLGLTMSQGISIALFVAGLATWMVLRRLPAIRHADGAKADAFRRPHAHVSRSKSSARSPQPTA